MLSEEQLFRSFREDQWAGIVPERLYLVDLDIGIEGRLASAMPMRMAFALRRFATALACLELGFVRAAGGVLEHLASAPLWTGRCCGRSQRLAVSGHPRVRRYIRRTAAAEWRERSISFRAVIVALWLAGAVDG